jgi:DNA-directed RNA polymerase subunit K/omega
MMDDSIDRLLAKAKNKFLLSNAISGRAKQISEGSLPYINHFDPSNPIITAIREIGSDKIRIKISTAQKKKVEEIFTMAVKKEKERPSILEKLAKDKKKLAKDKKTKEKKKNK